MKKIILLTAVLTVFAVLSWQNIILRLLPDNLPAITKVFATGTPWKIQKDADNKLNFSYNSNDALTIATDGTVGINGKIGTAWTSVSFYTGWTNYSSGWQGVQYKKIGDLVFLRGLMQQTITSPTAWAFILPESYRPPNGIIFDKLTGAGIQRLDIYPDGKVTPTPPGLNGWFSLSGIVFSTAN